MSKVFSVDVMIFATAYIRAESAEEAAAIIAKMEPCLEFEPGQTIADGIEISGEKFVADDLPPFSLSPAMTAYPVTLRDAPSSLPPIAPEDFEVAHDFAFDEAWREVYDEPDADGADSESDDFRAFCEGATPAQLDAIIEKESAAGRHDMAAIARAVKGSR